MAMLAPIIHASHHNRLASLSRARGAFDEKVGAYTRMTARFAGLSTRVFYPVGAVDRRYVLVNSDDLLCEHVSGKTVTTDWDLAPETWKSPTKPKGTLGSILWHYNLRVKPSIKRTKLESASLNATKGFAAYKPWPEGNVLITFYVFPNGNLGGEDWYDANDDPKNAKLLFQYLPIVGEEAEALELGDEAWHGAGRFTIR